MKKTIAILLGFLAFGLVGYVGGQAQDEPRALSEAIRQLESRIERLERNQATRDGCACIPVPEGAGRAEVGGIHFYVVPVTGDTAKGGRK